MTEQAIFTGSAGAPWWIVLAIVAFPGVMAVLLTMASVIVIRRVNRADGNPPMKAGQIVKYTVLIGAFFGPMMQFGFQRLANWLTGQPIIWELLLVGFAITGMASMIAYELLRWQSQKRWPGLYALISVKHSSAAGHVGDTPEGDLTRMEDKTEPQ